MKKQITFNQLKRLVKESDEDKSIDFGMVNQALDRIVKLVSQGKMKLQDLYRDQRYGSPSAVVNKEETLKVIAEISRLAKVVEKEINN